MFFFSLSLSVSEQKMIVMPLTFFRFASRSIRWWWSLLYRYTYSTYIYIYFHVTTKIAAFVSWINDWRASEIQYRSGPLYCIVPSDGVSLFLPLFDVRYIHTRVNFSGSPHNIIWFHRYMDFIFFLFFNIMAVCVSYSVLKGGKRWVREATQQLFVCAILRLLLFFHVFPSPPVSTDAFDRQARESIYTRDTRTVDFFLKKKEAGQKKTTRSASWWIAVCYRSSLPAHFS